MRKVGLLTNCFMFGMVLFGCGGNESPNNTGISDKGRDSLKTEQSTDEKSAPVVSLTESEARKRLTGFIKENKKKYREYGEIEDIKLASGTYGADDALDYLFTVYFYPGGDFVYPSHFYYDSETDEVRELSLANGTETWQFIVVRKMVQGKISGDANLWNAYGPEIAASESIKAEFTIEGNKLLLDKKYLAAMRRAEKKLNTSLTGMEADQELPKMENEEGQ
jgi:hypothetical protein